MKCHISSVAAAIMMAISTTTMVVVAQEQTITPVPPSPPPLAPPPTPFRLLEMMVFSTAVSDKCKAAMRAMSADELTQASFASANIPEGAPILLKQLIESTKYKDKDMVGATGMLEAAYPMTSLGQPDSCVFLKGFHHCNIHVIRELVQWGVCIPAECSGEEALYTVVPKFVVDMVSKNAGPVDIMCSDTDSGVSPLATWSLAAVVMVLILLGLVATVVDMWQPADIEPAYLEQYPTQPIDMNDSEYSLEQINESKVDLDSQMGSGSYLMEALQCFSFINNWKLWTRPVRQGTFDCLDGLRALSMVWVIVLDYDLWEKNYSWVSNPQQGLGWNDNKGHAHGLYARWSAQPIRAGYFGIETFFFVTAFLLTMNLLPKLRQIGQGPRVCTLTTERWPVLAIYRWCRLIPCMAITVAICSIVGPQVVWPTFAHAVRKDMEHCRATWWKNLLLINNYEPFSEMCYAISWYPAVDFQLYLIGPLLVVIAAYSMTAGLLIPLVLITASGAYTFVIGVKEEWSINYLSFKPFFRMVDQWYTKPWTQCPAFLIGIMAAVIWHYKEHDLRRLITRTRAGLLFFACLIVVLATNYASHKGMQSVPQSWSFTENAAYVAVAYPACTLSVAVTSMVMFLGYGGLLKSILESYPLALLSRVTYSWYLIHPIVITIMLSGPPLHFNELRLGFMLSGIIATSFGLALTIYFLVERPFLNLQRFLLYPTAHKQGPKAQPMTYPYFTVQATPLTPKDISFSGSRWGKIEMMDSIHGQEPSTPEEEKGEATA